MPDSQYGAYFRNVDQIPLEDIQRWLKTNSAISLENAVANKALYPQTVPATEEDLKLELAILREVMRRKTDWVNIKRRKILIPHILFDTILDLPKLLQVFIDAHFMGGYHFGKQSELWTIILKGRDKDEVIGSLLKPNFLKGEGLVEIEISGRKAVALVNQVTMLPCQKKLCRIGFKIKNGTILNVSEGAVEVYGGRAGLIIDGRMI